MQRQCFRLHLLSQINRALPYGRIPAFLRKSSSNDNHPFTMTANPAVRSTKNLTPQAPLYL